MPKEFLSRHPAELRKYRFECLFQIIMPTVCSQELFQWSNDISLKCLIKWLKHIFFLDNELSECNKAQ